MRRTAFGYFSAAALLFASCQGQTALHIVPDERKLVLYVENFQNASASNRQYDPWMLGLASLLHDDFNVTGYFRMINEESRKKALRELAFRETGLVADNAEVIKILGPKWILSGDFIVADDTLSITARLTDVSAAQTIALARKSGPVKEFFQLTKSMSVDLMREVKLEITDSDVRYMTERIDTHDVEASLSNYEGEVAMRKADELRIKRDAGKGPPDADRKIITLEEAARRRFRDAVEEDPGYTRAKHNLHRLALMLPSGI